MEKNLIIEINRNLQLMNLNKKNLLTESKFGFIDDLSTTLRNIMDNKPTNETKWTSPSGREFDYSQIESLLRRAERPGFGDDLTQDLVWARDFAEIFPNDAYNAVLKNVEKDAVEELLNYFKGNNITDIDKIKETVSGFIKNNMGLEGGSAEMAEALLSETLSNKIHKHIQSGESIDEFPYVTKKARGIDVSNTRSATDDVTSGGARRSDIEIEDVELETVSKDEIDPNNDGYIRDGRRIRMYDADGNPRVEKIKPKEPEPIPTNTDKAELKLGDTIGELEKLDNGFNKFITGNKKLFNELDELFKKIDDPNISRAEKVNVNDRVREISKDLSSKWKRTFIFGGGEKGYRKVIQYLEDNKLDYSKSDRRVIEDVLKKMKEGLPEDFFTNKSRWEKFLNSFETVSNFFKGFAKGLKGTTTTGAFAINRIKNRFRGKKKHTNFDEIINNTKGFGRAIEIAEFIFATPRIRQAVLYSKENKSIAAGVGSLMGSVVKLVIYQSLLVSTVQSVAGSYSFQEILSKLAEWKEQKQNDPLWQPDNAEMEEMANNIAVLIFADWDSYSKIEWGKLEGGGVVDNIVLNIIDNMDSNIDVPTVRRIKNFISTVSFARAVAFEGLTEEQQQEITDSLKKEFTNFIRGDKELNEMLGSITNDFDNIMKPYMESELVDIIDDLQIQLDALDVDVTKTSIIMNTYNNSMLEQIISEFEGEKDDEQVKELIDKYIKYNTDEKRYEFKCGPNNELGWIEKDDNSVWSMKWPNDDTYYEFNRADNQTNDIGDNLRPGFCEAWSVETIDEGTGKKGYLKHKGLVTILEQGTGGRGTTSGTSGSSGSSSSSGDTIWDRASMGPFYNIKDPKREPTAELNDLYEKVMNYLEENNLESKYGNSINIWKNDKEKTASGKDYTNPPTGKDELVYTVRKSAIPGGIQIYVIEEDNNGITLSPYNSSNETIYRDRSNQKSINDLNEMKRNKKIMKEEINDSLPKMIDDKLREFNFYSANDKGKQKVVFNDEDREEISRLFDDLIKKYPEDVAFIRAVVIAKGVDKKTEEPVVRLGSYYNNADIELPFNSQMNGLGKLLDGGVIYFTIVNNEGPDLRDFKIVGGDRIPEVEFNEPDKEEIALDNYTNGHEQEMAEIDEPFEEVMKKKEQKGLASLLEKGDVTNDLTKRQKEVLENLKKKGFKLSKPENADIYERVRVNSKEFNESIKAWKPKGK